MKDLPHKGEKVAWQTSQGTAHGKVEKIITSTTKIKGYTAKATEDHPEVLVKSTKSAKHAIHKPAALDRD